MQSDIVQVDFAEVCYINHDVTVHRNFDIITLLYVEGIVTILNMMLICKEDKLLITPHTVFSHLFLTLMKGKGKCLKAVNSLHTLKGSHSECC